MRIAAIHTYPIKGCYRLDHESAAVQRWGLAGDRRWLLVDPETATAITQRDIPALTQIRPRAVPGGLLLRTSGRPDLTVTEPVGGEPAEISLWSFTGLATWAGGAADEWLSTALQTKVRLVWQDDPTRRAVEPQHGQPGDTVAFPDGYPVLLANAASLDALNDLIAQSGSLEGPLPMTRFRPNLVLTEAPAWAEDGWTGGRIRVGDLTFRVTKPCGRCVVTTTDQETGERGHEPLRTLGRFRNVNQALLFATNLIPEGPGTVNVGDPVEAI